jgi:predicted Zn-dependent peptidase
LTRKDARRFFETFYGPENATCVLTGDVVPDEAFKLAERYLGGIPRRSRPPLLEPVETAAIGEKRLVVEAAAEPRVEVLWPAPSPGSPDHIVLDVVAALLEGEHGRLHRELVLEHGIALATEAENDLRRHAARFRVAARAGATENLDDLEAALDEQIEALRETPAEPDELDRAKRRLLANHVRSLETLEGTADRLGQAAATLTWRDVLDRPRRIQAVTPERVQEVARRTFVKRGRTVGVLAEGSPEEAPLGGPKAHEPPQGPPPRPHPRPHRTRRRP